MGKSLRTYTPDQTDEGQGIKETTGIASCFVNFLPVNTALYDVNNGYRSYDWQKWGLIDGAPAMIQNLFTTFQNKTGQIEKLIDVQLLGTAGSKMNLKLKNLTKNAIARMHGGSNDPIIGLSRNPGTRKKVITFSAILNTGDIFAWSFKTTNISTGTVSTVTPVSVPCATSDVAAGTAMTSAITANTGILSAVYDTTAHTMTVTVKPGYFLTSTVTAALTGGAETIVTQTESDTSIITTAISAANGAITQKSFGVTTGDGAKIQQAITNGTFDGVPGSPQIRVLTGSTVVRYEYPNVARVIGDVVYLTNPLNNLPSDLAVVDVVATTDYYPMGLSLPQDVEIQLDFRNHSNKSEYIVYIPRASHDTATKPPNFTPTGFIGEIDLIMIDTLLTVNGVQSLRPYSIREVNSSVGTD